MTIRKAMDDYKTVYMPYRNFAERTRVEYQNDLEGLVRFLEQSGIYHVKDLGLPIIERFVAHLEQQGFASLTRKRKVVSIRSFLSFLYQDGYITTDIGKRVVLPFTESPSPHVLTHTECDRLRNACADSPRDSAIIELLLQTGIKLSELVHLTLDDIEFDRTSKDQGSMRVLGTRGKKERVIPLNNKACVTLQNYFSVRTDAGTGILFVNRFGESLGESGVQKMLRKYLERAGIGGASIHTLRHTFGASQIAKGTSKKMLQDVMGLRDSRSTSKYFSLVRGLAHNP